MTRILALLDRPSARSFGMVPVAVEIDDKVRVTGLSGGSRHRAQTLTIADVGDLVDSGHALRVSGGDKDREIDDSEVALWLGHGFEEEAEDLALPPPPRPGHGQRLAEGDFYLGRAAEMFVYLDQWVAFAFARFREEDDPAKRTRIASLLRWALPSDRRTLAALWLSAPDSDHQLERQLRTFARKSTKSSWRSELEKTLNASNRPYQSIRIFAIAGGSGSRRSEFAEEFFALASSEVRGAHVVYKSFGAKIEKRLSTMIHASPPGKIDKMERGQALVERSPLAFALDVLDEPPSGGTVLVDGIRHRAILEVLKWLAPKDIITIAVWADENVRRKRIRDKGDDPDWVLLHPTESEIPKILSDARLCVDTGKPWDAQLKELVALVQGR